MSQVYKSFCSAKAFDGYSKHTEKKNDMIKKEVNGLISSTVNESSRTLMLDSGSGNTSKQLFRSGVLPMNNIVPNYHAYECDALEKLGYSTPVCSKLSDCLKTLKRESITHTWFDYCVRWNEMMKNDIRTLFENHILTPNGEFSITFGFRRLDLTEEIAELKDYANVVSTFIINTAECNGYKIVPVTSFFYGTVSVKGHRGRPRKIMMKMKSPTSASMMFQMYKCIHMYDEDLYL